MKVNFFGIEKFAFEVVLINFYRSEMRINAVVAVISGDVVRLETVAADLTPYSANFFRPDSRL